jgi:hypothetical protein
VFENRVLRRIYGPKRDEVTGKWKEVAQCWTSYFILLPKFY